MMSDSKFAIQLLEKIGAPLLGAINQVSADDEAVQEQAAQVMAKLLGQSVQMGTMLYNAVEIKESEEQADSTRLALAGLCAPLMAAFYTKNKAEPSDDDIKRMSQSLEAILSFGENFSPAAQGQSRLQTIDEDVVLFDKNQPILMTIQAMVPVINAVEEFPFGQQPRKLIQDITAKLEARAAEMAAPQGGDKVTELVVFKALAALYAQCYKDEVVRVSSAGDEARGELSVDPIWASFETKISMVEVVMGVDSAPASADIAPAPATTASTPLPETPAPAVQEAAPVAPAPVESNSTSAAPVAAAAGTAGPMGFFKKPKEGEAAPPPTASAPAEAAPVAAAPVETAQVETASSETTNDAPPSSPMGFFKPGAKKKDDDA